MFAEAGAVATAATRRGRAGARRDRRGAVTAAATAAGDERTCESAADAMTPKSRTRRVRCALSLYAQLSPLPHHQFHELGFAAALPLPPLSQALLCALLCSVGLCGANAGATRPARGARSRVWRRRGASRRPARDDPPGKGEAEAALLLPGGGRRGRPPAASTLPCGVLPCTARGPRHPPSQPLRPPFSFSFFSFLFFDIFDAYCFFLAGQRLPRFGHMCLPALFPSWRRLEADAPPLGGEGPDSPISTDGARAPALRPRSRVAAVGDSLVAGGARGRTKAPEADGPEPPAPAPRRISAATVRTRAPALRARPRPTALTRIIIMAGRSPTRRAAHFLMIRSQCLTLPPAPRRCRLRLLLYFSLHVNSLDVPLWRRRWSWQSPRARA